MILLQFFLSLGRQICRAMEMNPAQSDRLPQMDIMRGDSKSSTKTTKQRARIGMNYKKALGLEETDEMKFVSSLIAFPVEKC
jgi:hypothetical protein